MKSFLVGWSWKSGIIFYCDDDGGEGDDDDVGVDDNVDVDDDYAADDNVNVDDDYAADDVVDVYDDYAVDDDVDGDNDDDIGTCRNKLPYPLQWPGWLLTLTPRPMILRWFFPFPFQYNH